MAKGGYREGSGRPVGTTGPNKAPELKKSGRIVVCTEDEMNQIKELAKSSDKTTSRFIVDTILNK
jgi:hypothetical protein